MSRHHPMHSTRQPRGLESIYYYLMRLLPFAPVRRVVSAVLVCYLNWLRLRKLRIIRPPLTREQAGYIDSLRWRGWVQLPPVLAPSKIDEIVAFLKDKDLIAPNGCRFRMDKPGNNVLASTSTLTTLLSPHVPELMNHPDVLAVSASYLGCEPTISCVRIDWYAPNAGEPARVQKYHRDYDDWRFIKFFVYLTDVDDNSGPHEYVQGSHLKSGRMRATSFEREQLEPQYGHDSFMRVCGPRGTSFMVDTYGIHKGNAPVAAPRLMLQIEYSLLPVLIYHYDAVEMALPLNASHYTNRLLIA
jgi:hypothetical protein